MSTAVPSLPAEGGTKSMTMVILDRTAAGKLIRQRRAAGNDRWDEVWDGVYILTPNPNIEHQDIATGLSAIFRITIDWAELGKVYQGVNVSDRQDDWTQNYRCPDVAVYLKENRAEPRGAYWLGGPDFAVEIVSPDDRSREKLDFYAKVGVQELLLIDREPWGIELYQRREMDWVLTETSAPDRPELVTSAVLPLRFRLVLGPSRPSIEVLHEDGVQRWSV